MRGLRLSIAGMMTLVGVIALDCASVVHAIFYWDQSPHMAVFLLFGVMPVITAAAIAMLVALQPPVGRRR
jgi:hypothetical protein